MKDEHKVYIDLKINNIVRRYKEKDNILYTIGIDNLVLGLVKISSVSNENEESNINLDFNIKKLKEILPLGMYINGVIAIYNENTFEDFESILNEQIDKIKELNKEICIKISPDEITYLQLAMKELLYLDDEEEFSFEYKKYGDLSDDDVEIDFTFDILNKFFSGNEAKYKILVHNVQVLFNNQNNSDLENIISLNKSQLGDINYLDGLCNSKNSSCNKGLILKIKDQDLIIDTNLDDKQVFSDIKIDNFNESNKNINKLFYKNIQLGIKKNTDDEQIIENIIISDIDIQNNIKSNFYLETIGIISNKCHNYEEILSSMILQLKNNISNILSTDGKYFIQKVVIYNQIYSSLPFIVTSKTPINVVDNKLSIIKKDINNKTIIEDEILLTKIYHLLAPTFYNFGPIIENKENKEDKKGEKYQHLMNPHLSISDINKPPTDTHIIRAMVKGDYYYYHYNQDNYNDAGWGCAYRSLQTLFSWFVLNTSIGKDKKVPTIPEIQTTLVKLGDKNKSIIGSTNWIGAIEVNLVLNELLGIENQILYVPTGPELNSKGRELLFHFQHNGTPVMVGGGKFAYTILGVDYDKIKGECKFLILDPHYGGEDDIKTLVNKGWCNWKTIDLFKKEDFYNLCLPLPS